MNDSETGGERSVARCELTFQPRAEYASVVRRFVSDFYSRTSLGAEVTARLALATHELVENAVKYSNAGDPSLSIDVVEHGGGARISIRTRNLATPADIENVDRACAAMRAADDPFTHYRDTILRAQGLRSGIGLARIRAEADMEIRVEEGNDGQVTISAEANVPLTESADADRHPIP